MPFKLNNDTHCFYCESEFGTIVTLNGKKLIKTKDHLIPKSRGGVTRDLNLRRCCQDCNVLKGNKNPEEFLDKLYYLIGLIMEGKGIKTDKYPIKRLRIILKNNIRLIDQIASYKHKLTAVPKITGKWINDETGESQKK